MVQTNSCIQAHSSQQRCDRNHNLKLYENMQGCSVRYERIKCQEKIKTTAFDEKRKGSPSERFERRGQRGPKTVEQVGGSHTTKREGKKLQLTLPF